MAIASYRELNAVGLHEDQHVAQERGAAGQLRVLQLKLIELLVRLTSSDGTIKVARNADH